MPPTRPLAAAIAWVVAWLCLAPGASTGQQRVVATAGAAPAVEITFLDVGQGDAVLVRAPEGATALIDAGSDAPLAALRAWGVDRIDLLIATHPHADHIGGMRGVLSAVPVRFYMDNGQAHTTVTYRNLLATLERRTDVGYLAAEPRTVSLGSVALEVLPLPPLDVDHNNRSIGIVLRFGSFLAFFSGDSEIEELEWLVARGVVPDVTLLKAPHHGSNDAVADAFLARARPEVVVVSVGRNAYGHPGGRALRTYRAHAMEIYRTDLHGSVTLRAYEDGRYEVRLSGPDE
jgi:beta-lactamase superfamily II metal-dependent hydrolase